MVDEDPNTNATRATMEAKAFSNRRLVDGSSFYLLVPRELRVALLDATRLGSGEVHVETAAGRGSIFAARGAIAWIARESEGSTLGALLERRGLASRDDLRATYQACVRDKTNFAETLIDRGLVARASVREALLDHNARHLLGLANASIRSHRVVHRFRAYSSDLVFTLDELLSAATRLAHTERGVASPPSHPVATRPAGASTYELPKEESNDMADIKQSLEEVMKIDGAIATALVDWESGLTLGTLKAGAFDIELAASGNTQVVRAKMNVMKQLGIKGPIEDILISLDTQYHLIRPLSKAAGLFLYVAIDKERSNLGLARHRLRGIEESLAI